MKAVEKTFKRIERGIFALVLAVAAALLIGAAPHVAYADSAIMVKAYVYNGPTILRAADDAVTFHPNDFGSGLRFESVDDDHKSYISVASDFLTVHGAFSDSAFVMGVDDFGNHTAIHIEVGWDLDADHADVSLHDAGGGLLPESGVMYDGTEQKPEVWASFVDPDGNEWPLYANDAFDVTYTDNKDAGTATVTLTAKDGNTKCKGSTETQFKINPLTVTVSGVKANGKVYDGTAEATLDGKNATIEGAIKGDDVFAEATGTFEDKNVGKGKAVVIDSISLGGDQGGNYMVDAEISQRESSADIDPAPVTVDGITAWDKEYDGTTKATLDCSKAKATGVIDGDNVTVKSASGIFEGPDPGKDKVVDIADIELGGDDAGNYYLPAEGQQQTTTATIWKKENEASENSDDKKASEDEGSGSDSGDQGGTTQAKSKSPATGDQLAEVILPIAVTAGIALLVAAIALVALRRRANR